MIYTWLADISKLTEEKCFKKFYELVPEERKRKADRLRFPMDRARVWEPGFYGEKMKSYYGWSGEETLTCLTLGSMSFAVPLTGRGKWSDAILKRSKKQG